MDICFCDIKPLEFHSIEGTCVKCSKQVDNRIQHLLTVARAAKTMLRHENSPDWKKGLIPWREIAEGVNVDDLAALAEALAAVEDLL